ncbi:hypothetical protein BUALT_Bualt12G0063300 [Buddleja alternifolia]|uniref:Myb/SANT-like domain-containing protein n=1 Tax=Buddleja alternifolia TaxID=168488 RepID=A0AAV6WTY3_9LAMI|nr:hypothetical protein BUALT_Bualt12G0063300 [Buddleja alternifolia]
MAHRRPDQVSHMRRIVELSDTSCVDNLRMNRNVFGRMCYLLEHVGGLVDSRHASLSEKPVEVEPTDSRWKWSKGCLGALDGSYINVRVRDSEKPRYRNRKGEVSINLLGEMFVDPLEHVVPDLHVNLADADDNVDYVDTIESSSEWSNWRDSLANAMFTKWRGVVLGSWKSDNGFRIGYLCELEKAMIKSFPGTNLHAQPHINSKMHTWKKQYGSLFAMIDSSGLGWNETTSMLDATDEAWEKVVKNDPNARLMRYKSWPFYRDWCEVFGKDRAPGQGAKDIVEAIGGMSNDDNQTENLMGGEADYQENAGEIETTSMNEAPSSSSSKKISKGKRKSVDYQYTVVKLLGTFVEKIGDRLGEIACNLSLEYDIILKQNKVFKIVEDMEDLTEDEKLIASQMLVKNADDLRLFFRLPVVRKIKYVRMKLDGRL